MNDCVNEVQLSPEQKAAVEFIGPALLVAGAGSGKTRTLTAKIAHLINNGYLSENILAITFTNKAADEMKNRLVDLTGLSPHRFPWVRTYHSACFQILKQHCNLLGYQFPLQIYSEYQQQKLLKEIIGIRPASFEEEHLRIITLADQGYNAAQVGFQGLTNGNNSQHYRRQHTNGLQGIGPDNRVDPSTKSVYPDQHDGRQYRACEGNAKGFHHELLQHDRDQV